VRRPVLDVYARLSYAADGSMINVDDQIEQCEERLAARGAVVGERFKDNSLSAWNPKVVRKDFNRLMDRLETGASDGVVVLDLTQFTRFGPFGRIGPRPTNSGGSASQTPVRLTSCRNHVTRVTIRSAAISRSALRRSGTDSVSAYSANSPRYQCHS